MPDNLGRYSLSDMRDRVRRLLASVSIVVNQTTGAETGSPVIQDQSYSNTDLVNQVNESLMSLYGQMIMGKETLFSSRIWVSIVNQNPGPYSFPLNMVQLRWMKWKHPNIAFTPPASPRPIEWHPMVQVDDPNDHDSQVGVYKAPTWRWDAGVFYLNHVPQEDNVNGIMMNIVTVPNELVADTDIISMPQFVRFVQQALIYDVAYTLAFSKQKQVPGDLAKKRDEWHTLLMTLVENAYNTQSVQMVAPSRMIRDTYTGRSRFIGSFGRSR